MSALTPNDLQLLTARGIDAAEATEQLRRLREGFAPLDVRRPATPGDGIGVLSAEKIAAPTPRILEARSRGRVMRFVPASGAASRMFQSLLAVRNRAATQSLGALRGEDDAAAADVVRFFEELEAFPFAEALAADARSNSADLRDRLAALLDADGLDYAQLPKGMIPFHREGERSLTAFEEQLRESLDYADRVHFTVAPEHRSAIEAHLGAAGHDRLQIEYSEQSPATDTIAGDANGLPLRDASGRLVLRPGGHGALLRNLDQLGGDVVYLKNIDNVAPARLRALGVRWKLLLGEELLKVHEEIAAKLERLDGARPTGHELEQLEEFCARRLGLRLTPAGLDDAQRRERVHRALQRPVRVCGMVRNLGEPGGGPYWVRSANGEESLQIVEASQIDRNDPIQADALSSATHFNPVDLVCALRDASGESFDLSSFVDREAGFLSVKSKDGTTLRALERPGLWNGSMADWNTLFVEVPAETFTPVKTVLDLLREEHRE